MDDIRGKLALVTGSAQGIGAVIAKELARRGARVLVNCAHSPDKAAAVCEAIRKDGGDAEVLICSVTDEAELAAKVAPRPIDILVNTARRDPYARPEGVSDGAWFQTLLETNLAGAYLAALAVIAILAVANHIVNRRRRQQLQLQLRQIQEVQENRPPTVRQAAKSVEDAFLASDEYAALQRRMATGSLMKAEEWQQVEHSLKTVYPGFTAQLQSLYPMSDVEYHTCLLIKLRIPTKDIAAVLAREANTISSLRKRLYKKVFDREGGAKDWDDFILIFVQKNNKVLAKVSEYRKIFVTLHPLEQ